MIKGKSMKSKNGSVELMAIFAFLFGIGMLGLTLVQEEAQKIPNYLETTHDNVIGIYPNEMTKEHTDYFVATKDEGILYVEVNDSGENFSHTSTPIEDNETLQEMSEASIKMKEAKTARSRRTTLLFFPK